MNFDSPTGTVLYSIEKAIKAYRRLSQHNISQVVPDITVDQALILLMLDGNDKTQTEIADLIFKDYASMTRIVKLMTQKDYLVKTIDAQDKRKSKLEITAKGRNTIKKLQPMIQNNRDTALNNVSDEELKQLYGILHKITQNCQSKK
ncbi:MULTISPECIES: MarR family winged helix-turn-helix transcriptional regulator [unclassified Aureispira]|uniref:MarR family winged helix-turn-helix transcriptional regulator n=1 Tax=unclassified Aureispira TaxID=2649989 RepID=UPI0006979B14|nr:MULTISPECIES: MarR family winged helix-turn-helix transcriptional regulator [unclassified Aureispira]WMX12340.1 MarR family winged helix-turn-helix transcriptional regulator [Aureispira sp. CCB-E]